MKIILNQDMILFSFDVESSPDSNEQTTWKRMHYESILIYRQRRGEQATSWCSCNACLLRIAQLHLDFIIRHFERDLSRTKERSAASCLIDE